MPSGPSTPPLHPALPVRWVTRTALTFTGPVALVGATVPATTTVKSDPGGDITFTATVNAIAGGAQDLMVNTKGVTTFGGAVGGLVALQSLTTDRAVA